MIFEWSKNGVGIVLTQMMVGHIILTANGRKRKFDSRMIGKLKMVAKVFDPKQSQGVGKNGDRVNESVKERIERDINTSVENLLRRTDGK